MFRLALFLLLPLVMNAQGMGKRLGPRSMGARGEVLAHVHEMRLKRIQQHLGLPEPQAKAIADRWARFDQESMERAQRLFQIRRQFKDLLVSPGGEEDKSSRLRPLLEEFVRTRKEQQDLKSRFEEDIRASLTPAQQVRMILLVEDLQRDLLETLRNARQGRGRVPLQEIE